MEEDRKKKKNKKKKNKQNKTALTDDAVAPSHGETASFVDQKHGSNGHDNCSQVSGTADVVLSDISVQDTDVNRDRHTTVTTESILAESEEQQFLQREAMSEKTIIQLQNEKFVLIQNEAMLEGTIKQLQNEKYVLTQKEADLEMKLGHLQMEKDSWLQKKESLEENNKQLERDKASWVLQENSSKEIISSLNDDITRLQAKVAELEESMNSLLQDRQQLVETLSNLQAQIQNTPPPSDEVSKQTSDNEDLNFQLDAAGALIEKLITENAELIEKVNELCIELDQQSATTGLSSTIESYPMVGTADPISESTLFLPEQKLESLEMPVTNETVDIRYLDANHAAELSKISGAEESEEIVQIPLSDTEVPVPEIQVVESDKKTDVLLSDAPLIGAPFRLISFVAKYVSGADLVNENSV